jgi:hypothetical protein|mmetsp:Transcript_110575/g.172974  ORF Transcript_110575/g.172974 Transcript_110575/m.172974 type:complete len:216 (+) Transcript_110575:58-705(+)
MMRRGMKINPSPPIVDNFLAKECLRRRLEVHKQSARLKAERRDSKRSRRKISARRASGERRSISLDSIPEVDFTDFSELVQRAATEQVLPKGFDLGNDSSSEDDDDEDILPGSPGKFQSEQQPQEVSCGYSADRRVSSKSSSQSAPYLLEDMNAGRTQSEPGVPGYFQRMAQCVRDKLCKVTNRTSPKAKESQSMFHLQRQVDDAIMGRHLRRKS